MALPGRPFEPKRRSEDRFSALLGSIFRRKNDEKIKAKIDVEKDMKDFRVEDWNEDWDKGIHDQKVETYSYDIYNRFVDRLSLIHI